MNGVLRDRVEGTLGQLAGRSPSSPDAGCNLCLPGPTEGWGLPWRGFPLSQLPLGPRACQERDTSARRHSRLF